MATLKASNNVLSISAYNAGLKDITYHEDEIYTDYKEEIEPAYASTGTSLKLGEVVTSAFDLEVGGSYSFIGYDDITEGLYTTLTFKGYAGGGLLFIGTELSTERGIPVFIGSLRIDGVITKRGNG